jgi:hypothetical protein
MCFKIVFDGIRLRSIPEIELKGKIRYKKAKKKKITEEIKKVKNAL